MAKKKKEAEPPSPDKLIRDRPRQYHTADGRFEVQAETTGSWYLTDSEHTNELGLPRLLGPFATLDEVREAVTEARETPTGKRPKLRLVVKATDGRDSSSTDDSADEADGSDDGGPAAPDVPDPQTKIAARPARPAGRARRPAGSDEGPGAGTAARPSTKPSKPAKPSWLDRLGPAEQTLARKLVAGLEAVGIADPEPIVRADLDASLPRVAPAVLMAELWADDLAFWADEAWVRESTGGRLPRGVRRDAAEALKRLLDGGAEPADLADVARMIAARTAGLVLERVSLGGRGRGSKRQLPSWRLMEIGVDGEPTGRTILLSEDDVTRAAPAATAGDD